MNDSISKPGSATWLCLVFLLTALLAGCAAPPVKTKLEAPAGWSAQQQTLAQLQDWQISGKLGVRQDNRLDSAVINSWSQQGPHFDIHLSSAVFGLGATNIRGTPDAIWFTRSGEETLYSDQPEALIWQQAGWTLPIRYLFYWIKGIPAPSEIESIRFSEAGQIYELEQAGWTVRYEEFHATQPYPLPRKVILRQGDVRLTLLINDWQLDPPSA